MEYTKKELKAIGEATSEALLLSEMLENQIYNIITKFLGNSPEELKRRVTQNPQEFALHFYALSMIVDELQAELAPYSEETNIMELYSSYKARQQEKIKEILKKREEE